MFRGKQQKEEIVDRCSLNINLNKKVIDIFDAMIANNEVEGAYQIGKPNMPTSPNHRQDALTFYFYKTPSKEAMDKIKEVAFRNQRKNANSLYENGFRYTGMGEIKKEHVEELINRNTQSSAIEAMSEFVTRGNSAQMSEIQFVAIKETFEEFGRNLEYSRDKGFTLEANS